MWTLYVLELEDGCYYVGVALDVDRRFADHLAGLGAAFTRSHKPIQILERRPCGTKDIKTARKLENAKTLEYAVKYGADKVKGGKYFIPSKLARKLSVMAKQATL